MPYLLDTNVFSEAKKRFYGFDFCPAFWDWIEQGYLNYQVYSVESVATELKKFKDLEISKWLSNQSSGFFLPLDDEAAEAFRGVSDRAFQEAATRGSNDAELSRFLRGADCRLIAQAITGGHDVVTLEVVVDDKSKKLKIPNLCRGFNVKCMTPFDMLRREGARFILDTYTSGIAVQSVSTG